MQTKFSRRTFFGAILGLIGTISIYTKAPIVHDIQRWSAQKYLTARYFEAIKGTGGRHPKLIKVSPWMFEQLEGELQANQRFIDVEAARHGVRTLAYHASTMMSDASLGQYEVIFS
jgi:hypothetical protein